jgi:hypothetical protein
MSVHQIFPNSNLNSGIKSLLSNEYIAEFFKKFCVAIKSRMWKFKRARNARYGDMDFLRVFFYSEIIGRSIYDTSELLNELFLSVRKGRRKNYSNGRKKRIIPHQTEVNAYLRKIGLRKAHNILRECLDFQLQEALDLKIITKRINVLIDFTEHAYYGKRDDRMIKGTNRQKGTKKMRHYLGFSILSDRTHLYAGLEHVPNGQSKIPLILQFLDHLLDLGFELEYVIMDREFYRAELLDEIKGMKGNVLIPAKSYKKVKTIVEEYLTGRGKRVRRYSFSSATETKFRFFQDVNLIIKAKRGFTLQAVKRDFQRGRLSLNDARRRMFVIMTTEKPKGKRSSWASRISLLYRKRWYIETGFSDLNRMNRRWKSSHDGVRYLDLLVRMLLYNAWKMNKSWVKKNQKLEYKRMAWTLTQTQQLLESLFLSLVKKSRSIETQI